MFRRAKKIEEAVEADTGDALIVASFEISPNPILIIDGVGIVVRANAAARGLLGTRANVGLSVDGIAKGIDVPGGHADLSVGGNDYTARANPIGEEGCLVVLAKRTKDRSQKEVMERFQDAARNVHDKLEHLGSAMQSVMHASSEQLQSAKTVGGGIDEVSNTFEVVAAAAQELDASISEITRQANQSSVEAEAAVERTEAANVTVRQLAESSERIGEVVGLIEEIAAQTNLLALNATIEAARAGEAGRGFAVVAAEVKNLAQQTTKATGDITQQISTIQSTMRDAVGAIDGINSTIKQISNVSTSIAGAVGQQSSATADISRNVLLAAENMRTLGDNVGAIAKTTEGTPAQMDAALTTTREVADLNGQILSQVEAIVKSLTKAA